MWGSGKGKKNGMIFRTAEWGENFRKESQRERETDRQTETETETERESERILREKRH